LQQIYWEVEISLENSAGNNEKLQSVDQVLAPKNENQSMSLLNLTWPDVLLASDWHELYSEHNGMNQADMIDASDNFTRQ